VVRPVLVRGRVGRAHRLGGETRDVCEHLIEVDRGG